MESVIKSLEQMVARYDRDLKGIEHRIGDLQEEIHEARKEYSLIELRMQEAAAAMDYLSKSRGEVKEAAKEAKVEV
jgi:chromosome segregation ATPase